MSEGPSPINALDAIESAIESAMASRGITWEQLMIAYIKWQDDPESLRQFIEYIKSCPHPCGGEPNQRRAVNTTPSVFPTIVGVNPLIGYYP